MGQIRLGGKKWRLFEEDKCLLGGMFVVPPKGKGSSGVGEFGKAGQLTRMVTLHKKPLAEAGEEGEGDDGAGAGASGGGGEEAEKTPQRGGNTPGSERKKDKKRKKKEEENGGRGEDGGGEEKKSAKKKNEK